MQLNSLFFPAPKTTQMSNQLKLQKSILKVKQLPFLIFLFIQKDNVIWIPRKSYYNLSIYSPKHNICNKQFIKKFGNTKPSSKIEQPTLEDDDDLNNEYCNLDTQEDELIEIDEYIPLNNMENRSLPIHVHNYITKNFLEVNSFQIKSPNKINCSTRQSSKMDEISYLSGSKQNSSSKQYSNIQTINKSLNDEKSISVFQEDDIRSEPLFTKINNSANEYCDEKQFYSQPISNQNKYQKNCKNQYVGSIQNPHKRSPFKTGSNVSSTHIIASLLKSNIENTEYIMIYFHSNGEDIFTCYELVNHLRRNLNIHVLTVEYPGYSCYEGSPNSEQILQDSLDVYYYVTEVMKVSPEKIIILGRSIGSGPATYLASQKKVGCLSLVSPFTSIRDLVKDKVGQIQQLREYKESQMSNIHFSWIKRLSNTDITLLSFIWQF